MWRGAGRDRSKLILRIRIVTSCNEWYMDSRMGGMTDSCNNQVKFPFGLQSTLRCVRNE